MADQVIVELRKKTGSVESVNKSNQSLDKAKEFMNEKKIGSLGELSPGDHIVICTNDEKKYCHSILEKVDAEKKIIEIIYFDNSQTQCVIEQFRVGCSEAAVCQINSSDNSGKLSDDVLCFEGAVER